MGPPGAGLKFGTNGSVPMRPDDTSRESTPARHGWAAAVPLELSEFLRKGDARTASVVALDRNSSERAPHD